MLAWTISMQLWLPQTCLHLPLSHCHPHTGVWTHFYGKLKVHSGLESRKIGCQGLFRCTKGPCHILVSRSSGEAVPKLAPPKGLSTCIQSLQAQLSVMDYQLQAKLLADSVQNDEPLLDKDTPRYRLTPD